MDAADLGIPELDPARQLLKLVPPVVPYGSVARDQYIGGTLHFYTDDTKFTRLIAEPGRILATGCRGCVEANFSTGYPITRVEALYGIFQKRRLARYWQDHGVDVCVDLNVNVMVLDIALLGVPRGWRSYCTRKHALHTPATIEARYAAAVRHAGTADIFFALAGGGPEYRKLCEARGWSYISEYARVARGREEPTHGRPGR